MAYLSTSEVEAMREAVNEALPDTLDIYRLEKVYDGGGSYNEEWILLTSDVPCFVGLPLGGETDVRAVSRSRLADEDLYTIRLPAETDITDTDQIEWEDGRYEVNVVLERGVWELTRRIRVKEL